MDVLLIFAQILSVIILLLIGYFLPDYIYFCLIRKRFQIFIREAKKDRHIKLILEEISANKIKVRPFGFVQEFLTYRHIFMLADSSFRKILIPDRVIKKALREKNPENWKGILYGLIHERGHLIKCLAQKIEFDYELEKYCERDGNHRNKNESCLYGELSATLDGIEIFQRLSGEKITEIFDSDFYSNLVKRHLAQCEKCETFLSEPKNIKGCPFLNRIKELEEKYNIDFELPKKSA